ncbi:MAG: lamin tail domain-containing protein [Phycisphaerales bacterium]|nr:lamin tail domain-containing protein [Phycisphaerales bacterium]
MSILLTTILNTAAATSSPAVIITEIMYDPASPERTGEPEWVEIANLGESAVDLEGWTLDDEDNTDWGKLEGTLEAGGVAVLINGEAASREDFLSAWADDPEADVDYLVLPIEWGSLANKPTDTNEVLQLLDAEGTVICEVNYGRGKGWPDPGRRGQSIFLKTLDLESVSKASNWSLTEKDAEGSRIASGNSVYTKPDVGSPGYVQGIGEASPARPAPTAPASPKSSPKPEPAPKEPAKPAPPPPPAEDEDDIPY